MSPRLEALDIAQRTEFEHAYRRPAAEACPSKAEGETLFPFHRFLLVAERGSDG